MSDGLIIIAGIIFVFVVWVWTGGPSRPISFAGPFITPLTTVGDTQEGYGPQIDISDSSNDSASYWSLKSVAGSYEGSAGNGTPSITNPSPYRGQVTITSGSSGPSYSDAREYVSIRNALGSNAVSVSGWSIVSDKTGVVAYLPQAAEIADPDGNAALSNITLESGEEAVVYTGRSPAGGQSFLENACSQNLDDERQYDDCVSDHRRDSNFYGDTWFVYLNRSKEVWSNDHETLRLVDTQGRTVDLYSY